jgi:hypothetical protein
MTTHQARRKLIVIVLLCFAVGGAAIRHFAAPGSTVRDVGTLMMLLWLPIIGNVISWSVSKLRRPAVPQPSPFEALGAFHPHARVELTLRAAALPSEDTAVAPGEHRCALVVGSEAFSVRWWAPADQALRRGTARRLEVEFLAPALARLRFLPETRFRMLVGDSFVGDGIVLEALA